MRQGRTQRAVFVLSLLFAITIAGTRAQFASAQTIESPSVFLNSRYGVTSPIGIALDASGNIYIFEGNNLFLQKFRPSRVLEREVPAPNPEGDFLANVHLTEDPLTGWIIGLKDDGILFAVGHGLNTRALANLKAVSWDESAIYDVGTGEVRPFPIAPGDTTFGHVYAVQVGTTTQLWITANSGITPFVMKLKVDLGAGKYITLPKVVVMSSGTTAPAVEPAGIAVGAGTVLTTLPISPGQIPFSPFVEEVAVVFSRSFVPGSPAGAPRILFPGPEGTHQAIGSTSIAADSSGNFYVETGTTGSLSPCGPGGSGAIIVIPKTLSTFKCYPIFNHAVGNGVEPFVEDIVVNAAGTLGYVAVHGSLTPPVIPAKIISFSIGP